jgi:hypothetical protein
MEHGMKHYLSFLIATIFLTATIPAFSSTITNNEIDKFIKSLSITSDLLDKVNTKLKKDEAVSKKLAVAQLEGKFTREMVSALKGSPEYFDLEALVKQSDFNSVEEWSLVTDRVLSVITSAQWVVLVASMPMPNSNTQTALTRETNLFEFLSNTNNDPKLREKYSKQLKEMCEKMCYDQSDLQVVGARFNEIKSAMKEKNR